MRAGKQDQALAYMRSKGMTANFAGAPKEGRVGTVGAIIRPEPKSDPAAVADMPGDPNYKYPDFKPIREPVPEGVRYARILRELSHVNQKVGFFEDDQGVQILIWMTLDQQQKAKARKGRLIGQVFPIERNPDERQAGWRIYRP